MVWSALILHENQISKQIDEELRRNGIIIIGFFIKINGEIER